MPDPEPGRDANQPYAWDLAEPVLLAHFEKDTNPETCIFGFGFATRRAWQAHFHPIVSFLKLQIGMFFSKKGKIHRHGTLVGNEILDQ